MDIIELKKQAPEISMEKIGAMESVEDLSCLMVNTIIISTVLVNYKEVENLGSQSVICQVACEFALIVNPAEWDEWVEVTGSGQHLHYCIYQLYELAYHLIAMYATDFASVNIY